ncbi:MAG TPA: class I SAM-dependent methyltransferase [Thermoanaerobaculia bacterium]|nr:class I SAM-dependent methyltransferase [Thermoanaerobaculia bacterium]
MSSGTFAAQYDAVISEPRMRRLYGDTGYFNVGLWTDGVDSLGAACDQMVDELAAAVPSSARAIVDAGCGLGPGTRRLMNRFPAALVTGVNLSLWQLTQVRERGVRATVATDAARMGFRDGSVDAVISVEAAQHFDTRADFLLEAARMLRPGGVLSIADMLFRDRAPIGPWMLPKENAVATPEAYAALLEKAGFVDVVVRDVTRVSWTPFCAVMRREFAGAEAQMRAIEESLDYYVLASARRP